MNDDDVYPNEGSSFLVPTEPPEQVASRKKEKAETLRALPIIKSVIQHFEERIEYRGQLDSINADLVREPAMHQKLCEVNKMLKLALEEEKQMLEELLEVHTKQR